MPCSMQVREQPSSLHSTIVSHVRVGCVNASSGHELSDRNGKALLEIAAIPLDPPHARGQPPRHHGSIFGQNIDKLG